MRSCSSFFEYIQVLGQRGNNHSYITFHIVKFEPVNSMICRILCASGQRWWECRWRYYIYYITRSLDLYSSVGRECASLLKTGGIQPPAKQRKRRKERRRKEAKKLPEGGKNLPATVCIGGHPDCSLEILNAEIRMVQLDALFRPISSGILEKMDDDPLQL